MNEDPVLGQLRDIHLPDTAVSAVPAEFALWPFYVLGAVVLLVIIARLWTRNRWRVAARRDLSAALSEADPNARWQAMLAFAGTLSSRSGRVVDLPEVAFQRYERIGPDGISQFEAFLSAEVRR